MNHEIHDGDCGISFTAKPQLVEIVMFWDGAERNVVRVDPKRLIEIAEEALEWKETVYLDRPPCKHIECGLKVEE